MASARSGADQNARSREKPSRSHRFFELEGDAVLRRQHDQDQRVIAGRCDQCGMKRDVSWEELLPEDIRPLHDAERDACLREASLHGRRGRACQRRRLHRDAQLQQVCERNVPQLNRSRERLSKMGCGGVRAGGLERRCATACRQQILRLKVPQRLPNRRAAHLKLPSELRVRSLVKAPRFKRSEPLPSPRLGGSQTPTSVRASTNRPRTASSSESPSRLCCAAGDAAPFDMLRELLVVAPRSLGTALRSSRGWSPNGRGGVSRACGR